MNVLQSVTDNLYQGSLVQVVPGRQEIDYDECITIFGTFVRWSFQFLTVRELNPSSTIGSHYHHHATLELLFYIFRHFYKR